MNDDNNRSAHSSVSLAIQAAIQFGDEADHERNPHKQNNLANTRIDEENENENLNEGNNNNESDNCSESDELTQNKSKSLEDDNETIKCNLFILGDKDESIKNFLIRSKCSPLGQGPQGSGLGLDSIALYSYPPIFQKSVLAQNVIVNFNVFHVIPSLMDNDEKHFYQEIYQTSNSFLSALIILFNPSNHLNNQSLDHLDPLLDSFIRDANVVDADSLPVLVVSNKMISSSKEKPKEKEKEKEDNEREKEKEKALLLDPESVRLDDNSDLIIAEQVINQKAAAWCAYKGDIPFLSISQAQADEEMNINDSWLRLANAVVSDSANHYRAKQKNLNNSNNSSNSNSNNNNNSAPVFSHSTNAIKGPSNNNNNAISPILSQESFFSPPSPSEGTNPVSSPSVGPPSASLSSKPPKSTGTGGVPPIMLKPSIKNTLPQTPSISSQSPPVTRGSHIFSTLNTKKLMKARQLRFKEEIEKDKNTTGSVLTNQNPQKGNEETALSSEDDESQDDRNDRSSSSEDHNSLPGNNNRDGATSPLLLGYPNSIRSRQSVSVHDSLSSIFRAMLSSIANVHTIALVKISTVLSKQYPQKHALAELGRIQALTVLFGAHKKIVCSCVNESNSTNPTSSPSTTKTRNSCILLTLKAFIHHSGRNYLLRKWQQTADINFTLMNTLLDTESDLLSSSKDGEKDSFTPKQMSDAEIGAQTQAWTLRLLWAFSFLCEPPSLNTPSSQSPAQSLTNSSSFNANLLLSPLQTCIGELPKSSVKCSVTDTEIIFDADGRPSHAVYLLNVAVSNTTWFIRKRFSEIVRFDERLRAEIAAVGLKIELVKMPRKTFSRHAFKASDVEKRRNRFHEYFQSLTSPATHAKLAPFPALLFHVDTFLGVHAITRAQQVMSRSLFIQCVEATTRFHYRSHSLPNTVIDTLFEVLLGSCSPVSFSQVFGAFLPDGHPGTATPEPQSNGASPGTSPPQFTRTVSAKTNVLDLVQNLTLPVSTPSFFAAGGEFSSNVTTPLPSMSTNTSNSPSNSPSLGSTNLSTSLAAISLASPQPILNPFIIPLFFQALSSVSQGVVITALETLNRMFILHPAKTNAFRSHPQWPNCLLPFLTQHKEINTLALYNHTQSQVNSSANTPECSKVSNVRSTGTYRNPLGKKLGRPQESPSHRIFSLSLNLLVLIHTHQFMTCTLSPSQSPSELLSRVDLFAPLVAPASSSMGSTVVSPTNSTGTSSGSGSHPAVGTSNSTSTNLASGTSNNASIPTSAPALTTSRHHVYITHSSNSFSSSLLHTIVTLSRVGASTSSEWSTHGVLLVRMLLDSLLFKLTGSNPSPVTLGNTNLASQHTSSNLSTNSSVNLNINTSTSSPARSNVGIGISCFRMSHLSPCWSNLYQLLAIGKALMFVSNRGERQLKWKKEKQRQKILAAVAREKEKEKESMNATPYNSIKGPAPDLSNEDPDEDDNSETVMLLNDLLIDRFVHLLQLLKFENMNESYMYGLDKEEIKTVKRQQKRGLMYLTFFKKAQALFHHVTSASSLLGNDKKPSLSNSASLFSNPLATVTGTLPKNSTITPVHGPQQKSGAQSPDKRDNPSNPASPSIMGMSTPSFVPVQIHPRPHRETTDAIGPFALNNNAHISSIHEDEAEAEAEGKELEDQVDASKPFLRSDSDVHVHLNTKPLGPESNNPDNKNHHRGIGSSLFVPRLLKEMIQSLSTSDIANKIELCEEEEQDQEDNSDEILLNPASNQNQQAAQPQS